MIELKLAGADLAQLRFGISPLSETLGSLAVLHSPVLAVHHRRWVTDTQARVRHMDLELLLALEPPGRRPRASLPVGDADTGTTIGQQLQLVADCPPELIRKELEFVWRGQRMPSAARQVIAEGSAGSRRIADLLASYWELAIAPHWPAIQALIEAEIARGARRIAERGIRALLSDLHPAYHITDGAFRVINLYHHCTVNGTGLRLIPSVFNWPNGIIDTGLNEPPSLIYGPRQAASVWDADRTTRNGYPLKYLLGRSRATILRSLEAPRSTTELARDLQQSPAAVSAHLSTLVSCGLATSWRSGRYVLYQRTPLATTLIATAGESWAQPSDRGGG